MAKKPLKFDNIEDADLRKKLEEVVSQHSQEVPPEVHQHPKFVFSRASDLREPGARVSVRNGLDDVPRGGTLLEKVGRAYRVDLGGNQIILVHEPDDSWGNVYD